MIAKPVLGLLLALVGCAPPWSRLQLPRPLYDLDITVTLPRFEQRVLSNGLTVWWWWKPDAPVVSAATGPAPPGAVPGDRGRRPRAVVRALARGTAHRDEIEQEQEFARLGATPDLLRSREGAALLATVLPERLPRVLELFSEVVRAPLDSESAFQTLRDEKIAWKAMAQDTPEEVGRRVLAEELDLPDAELDAPAYGSVSMAQLRTIRQALLDPRGAVLVLAGTFEVRETLLAIEGFFGSWRPPREQARPPEPPAPTRKRRLVLVPWPGLDQTHVILGKRLPPLAVRDEVALGAALGRYLGGLNSFRTDSGTSYGPRGHIRLDRAGGVLEVLLTIDARVTRAALRDSLGGLRELAILPDRSWGSLPREVASQQGSASGTGSAGHVAAAADLFLRGQQRDRPAQKARALAVLRASEVRAAIAQHLDETTTSVVVVGDGEVVRAAATALGMTLELHPRPGAKD